MSGQSWANINSSPEGEERRREECYSFMKLEHEALELPAIKSLISLTGSDFSLKRKCNKRGEYCGPEY